VPRTETLVAVVVGAVDYGDADRVVKLLSAEQGRTAAMAKSVRGARPRLHGLDTGTVVRAHLRYGRGGLPAVAMVDLLKSPVRARNDLDRLALLAYGCEVTSALAPEHGEAVKLFVLLHTLIEVLEGEALPGAASRVAFEGKALTFAGFAPSLTTCPRCGEALSGDVRFDPDAGGGVHPWCGSGHPVHADTLAAIEALRRTPLAETPAMSMPPEGRWLLADFVEHHLGHAVNSRSLLQTLGDTTPRPDPG